MVVWEELVQAEGGEENKIVAQEILLLVRNERVVEEVVHGLQLDFLNRGRRQMECWRRKLSMDEVQDCIAHSLQIVFWSAYF